MYSIQTKGDTIQAKVKILQRPKEEAMAILEDINYNLNKIDTHKSRRSATQISKRSTSSIVVKSSIKPACPIRQVASKYTEGCGESILIFETLVFIY